MKLLILLAGIILSLHSWSAAQTNWTTPVTVMTANNAGVDFLTQPDSAVDATNRVGLLLHGHSQVTSGTPPNHVPYKRHSDIFVSYSSDWGATWQATEKLSDPDVINAQGRVAAEGNGQFYYTWTSGDPTSAFRLHSANTGNSGDSYTCGVKEKSFTEQIHGYFDPIQIVTGGKQLAFYDAHYLQFGSPPFNFVFSYRISACGSRFGDDDWTTESVMVGYPYSSPSTIYNFGNNTKSVSNYNSQVMAVYCRGVTTNLRLKTSDDAGNSWQTTDIISSVPEDRFRSPSVASDGAGNWLLFYNIFQGFQINPSKLLFQRAENSMTTWTAPVEIPIGDYRVSWAGGDGDGRCLAILASNSNDEIRYIYSTDFGQTWSGLQTVPEAHTRYGKESVSYIANGHWALFWSEGTSVKMSMLKWGNSLVDEWSLY